MVNRLYRNIVWTQRANFMSVPTDCPQRDERLGWTGDAQTFVRAAHLQRRRGGLLHQVAGRPGGRPGAGGRFSRRGPARSPSAAAWRPGPTPARSAPPRIYRVYNDRRLLEKHYAAMVRWVEYCREAQQGLAAAGDRCGDWLSIKADTPKDVLATACFAHSTHLMADAARDAGQDRKTPAATTICSGRSRRRSTGPTWRPTGGSRATRRPATCWPCGSTCCRQETPGRRPSPGRRHPGRATRTFRPALWARAC